MSESTIKPTDIKLHQKSGVLEITFEDGKQFELPCEYLRCFSPSAEVRGHGPGQETLQVGKENVNIKGIEPVGNYAVRLCFDDGHSSGLYAFPELLRLGRLHDELWQRYLERLESAGVKRTVDR